MSSRLALGTVQMGMPYGVANRTGQVGHHEAAAILECARAAGMDTLDTAIAYGESESRLGEIGVREWKVVSKLPPLPESCADVQGWVRDSVSGSLERVGTSRLHGLLLHRSQDLSGPRSEELYAALLVLKSQGKVGKIGVSIYAPDELDALQGRFELDLVQAPFNAFDRRLATSGWLKRLRQAHVEVHVRSVFLQGLLLVPPHERPPRFQRWHALWLEWDTWLRDQQVTALQACLGFVLAHDEVDRLVVGVESVSQLRGILTAGKDPAAVPPPSLASEDPDLVNPSRWSKN